MKFEITLEQMNFIMNKLSSVSLGQSLEIVDLLRSLKPIEEKKDVTDK